MRVRSLVCESFFMKSVGQVKRNAKTRIVSVALIHFYICSFSEKIKEGKKSRYKAKKNLCYEEIKSHNDDCNIHCIEGSRDTFIRSISKES